MKQLSLAILLVVSVAGCANPRDPIADDFGNAVHGNIAAQVVNPAPNFSSDAPLANGRNVNNAYTRYVTGTVIQPVPAMQTIKYGDAPIAPPPVPVN